MAADVDLLILGGGCAGLSLARELATFGPRAPSTCVIEQRAQYEEDRTWCFWGNDTAMSAQLVEQRWSHVQLRAAGDLVDFSCGDHPYQMIRSSRFYAEALQALSGAPQLRVERAVTILSEPQWVQGMWQIDTTSGCRRGRMLIDTRPGRLPVTPRESPTLWQSFFGKEIICEAPVFNPDTATLMDFFDDQRGRIAFTYLLPFTAYRALIEVTLFEKSLATPADLSQLLDQQIGLRTGLHRFTVERSEHGILPMGLPPPRRVRHGASGPFLRVGLMHGAARASTGYAFQRIQRWAQSCAAQLVAGTPLQAHEPDPLLTRSMDRLFLSLLRRCPDTASTLFLSMFRRADPGGLMRFLTDRASLRDTFGIISSLPALPFIRQIGYDLVHPR